MDYSIETRRLPRRDVAAVKLRAKAGDIPAQMPRAFAAVVAYLEHAGIPAQGPAVAIYDRLGPDEFDVTAGFYVASAIPGAGDVVAASTPECTAAVTTHLGPYEELPRAYSALQAWMRREGWEPGGSTMWEEYHSPPGTPEARTRTDVAWPLRRREQARPA